MALRNQILKTKLLALLLMATGAVFGQVSIGVVIGAPPPVRIMRVQPLSPGDDYMWIGGYWYPNGNHYRWHNGYWTRPAYPGAQWVEPRHDGERYYQGYWQGGGERYDHDHRWDRGRSHQRDFDRKHEDKHEGKHEGKHDRGDRERR